MKRFGLGIVFTATVFSVGLMKLVQAENIPTTADVVLVYKTETDTAKHNYLFTVAADDAIYPCVNNRCNLGKWKNVETVIMTVYVLPEGFTSVSSIVNPEMLQSYLEKAEQTYVLKDITTNPTVSTGRAYQTVTLQADGSYSTATNNYVKPDVKDQRTAASKNNPIDTAISKQKIITIIGIAVVVAGLGIMLYIKRRRI